MDFLSKLLQGIAFVPAVVNGIENLFGGRSGVEKKDAAISFVQTALSMASAIERGTADSLSKTAIFCS